MYSALITSLTAINLQPYFKGLLVCDVTRFDAFSCDWLLCACFVLALLNVCASVKPQFGVALFRNLSQAKTSYLPGAQY